MGVVSTISHNRFPKQRPLRRVKVCFYYNTEYQIGGQIVRDDNEEPWQTIIRLDSGPYILATECQFSYDD